MTKPVRIIGRIAVILAALALTIALLVQVALWAGMGWVNSGAGQRFISAKLNTALAASGLHATVGDLHVLTLGGFSADHVQLADSIGPVADIDRLRFFTDLSQAAVTRTLALSITADTLVLHRLPPARLHAQPPKSTGVMHPFNLPDLYIHAVRIDRVAINRLSLEAPVMGKPMMLSPKLTARAGMNGNRLALDATLETGAPDQPGYLPKSMHVKGDFTSDKTILTLDDLSINAPALTFTGNGTANLGSGGMLALRFRGKSDNLQALTGKTAGTASLDGAVAGTADNPVFDLKGTTHLADLAAKGLADITLNAHVEHLTGDATGTLTIATAYGQRPATLATSFAYQKPVLSVNDLTLAAPDISVKGKATLHTDTKLADGDLSASFKLDSYKDLIGTDITGRGKADITFAATGGRQSGALSADIDNVHYKTITLRSASLTAALSNFKSPWPDKASLKLTAAAMKDMTLNTFNADIVRQSDAAFGLTLRGSGSYIQPFALIGSADLKGTTAATASASSISLKLNAGKGALNVTGAVLPDRIDIGLGATKFPLAALPVSLPANASNLSVSGKGTIQGPLNAPAAQLDLAFSPLQLRPGLSGIVIALKAALAEGRASLAMHGKGRGVDTLHANAAVPVTLSLKPFAFAMPGTSPVKADLAARLDAAALAGLLPPGVVLGGRMDIAATVGGTIAHPELAGTAGFTQGRFVDEPGSIALRDITLQAALRNNGITLTTLQATGIKGGSVSGSGVFGLGEKALANIKIAAKDLAPFTGTSQVQGSLSADLAFTGRSPAYTLGGMVRPGTLNITIPERFSSNIPQLNIVDPHKARTAPQAARTVTLGINVHAPNQVFVRGWGLDAEFYGDLTVNGNLGAPLINGNLTSKRGRYEEFNKRFDLNHAILRFQGAVPPSPYLDIEAQNKLDDFTALITLTGPVKEPVIALTSVPALPQDQVLSHILFGKDMSSISPFQAIQLAGTLQRFTGHGGGGPGLMDKLRDKTGLDDLEVNNDASGATTVGAGKYLTDKVYLQVDAGNATDSGSANVQYQLSPHVTLNSKVSQDDQAGGGVNWSWDY